jgi:hypothetical protein
MYITRSKNDNCKGMRHNGKNTILTGLLRHTKTNLCIDNHVFGISRSVLFFAVILLTSRFVEKTHKFGTKCVLILHTDFSLNVSQPKEKLTRPCHKFMSVVINCACYLCAILNKLRYSRHSLWKSRRYPYFDVVVGLVWSHDPKSYAGGSVCYW